jgi:hypothetical protein
MDRTVRANARAPTAGTVISKTARVRARLATMAPRARKVSHFVHTSTVTHVVQNVRLVDGVRTVCSYVRVKMVALVIRLMACARARRDGGVCSLYPQSLLE